MVRVTNGLTRHKRHRRFVKQAKGFRLGRNNVYKQVRIALIKQGQNAYIGRKEKKRVFRKLWIERLNAAVRAKGSTYSRFMGALTAKGVDLDRKVLSNIAIAFPKTFDALYEDIVR